MTSAPQSAKWRAAVGPGAGPRQIDHLEAGQRSLSLAGHGGFGSGMGVHHGRRFKPSARSCRSARWPACARAPPRPDRAGRCGRSAACSLPLSTSPHRSARMRAVDLAHLLDRARAERDADVVDALHGVQVEVELALEAAEPADVDDAAEHGRRLQVARWPRWRRPGRRSGRRPCRRWPSSTCVGPGLVAWCRRRDRRRTP